MNSKREKGQYGYRDYRKKRELLKVLGFLAVILALLVARWFVENNMVKNVLTLTAILTVIPMANFAAPWAASLPYKTPSKEFYDRVRKYEGKGVLLYDLIVTSKEFIMPVDAVMIHPVGVIIYSSSKKVDGKVAEKYLNNTFQGHRLDPNAKVITDENGFFKRLEGMKPSSEYEDDGSVDYAVKLLKNLSM